MTPKTLSFSVVDDVLLIAHGTEPPTDAEWDQLVSLSLDLYRTRQLDRTLATSDGGAPTAAQRHRFDLRVREVIAVSGTPRVRIAIMSRSPFVRAVVTASTVLEQGWVARVARGMLGEGESSRIYRAFSPAEIMQAIAWLGVPKGKTAEIVRTLERLKSEVSRQRE